MPSLSSISSYKYFSEWNAFPFFSFVENLEAHFTSRMNFFTSGRPEAKAQSSRNPKEIWISENAKKWWQKFRISFEKITKFHIKWNVIRISSLNSSWFLNSDPAMRGFTIFTSRLAPSRASFSTLRCSRACSWSTTTSRSQWSQGIAASQKASQGVDSLMIHWSLTLQTFTFYSTCLPVTGEKQNPIKIIQLNNSSYLIMQHSLHQNPEISSRVLFPQFPSVTR